MKEQTFLYRVQMVQCYYESLVPRLPEHKELPEFIISSFRNELTNNYPKELSDTGLTPVEGTTLALTLLEDALCSIGITRVAQFWSDSLEERLQIQFKLTDSINNGNLKEFLIFDGRRIEFHPDKKMEVIQLFTNLKD